jgi:hypothetical protein
MNHSVIFFTASGSIGQQDFETLTEAEAFELLCLDKGHTTSGVLST